MVEISDIKKFLKLKMSMDQRRDFRQRSTSFLRELCVGGNAPPLRASFTNVHQVVPAMNRLRVNHHFQRRKEMVRTRRQIPHRTTLLQRLGLNAKKEDDAPTIRKKFRLLARMLHPDVDRSRHAKLRFQKIVQARDALLNDSDMKHYASTNSRKTKLVTRWTGKCVTQDCSCAGAPKRSVEHVLLHCPILNGARRVFADETNETVGSLSVSRMLLLDHPPEEQESVLVSRDDGASALFRCIKAATTAFGSSF